MKLKQVEALPISHEEGKAALLKQLGEAAGRGKSLLAAKLTTGNLTLGDLNNRIEVWAYIHSLELENAIDDIFSGKGGLSQLEKQTKVAKARLDVQLLENEVRQLA